MIFLHSYTDFEAAKIAKFKFRVQHIRIPVKSWPPIKRNGGIQFIFLLTFTLYQL